MRAFAPIFAIPFAAAAAQALPTVDGVLGAGEYGPAVSVQTVETQFGDNFSELDAAYATAGGGSLYLMLTGNLESNFNHLNVFIDSKAGGQNVIVGASNPGNDNGWAAKHDGMHFDVGFDPDYVILLRNGNFGGDRFDFDFAVIGGNATDFDAAVDVFGGTLTGAGSVVGSFGTFEVGFDNSNAAGVAGGFAAANGADALAVTTGIELAIPLASIGSPLGSIRVSAMINNSGNDYLSNQFLGGLAPPQGNLGGDGAGGFIGNLSGIDLPRLPGDQFFDVVVPEPSTLTLFGVGMLGLARSRRRTRTH